MFVVGAWNLAQAAHSTSIIWCSGSSDVIEEANLPVVVVVDAETSCSPFAEDAEGSQQNLLVCSLIAVLLKLEASI